MKRVLYSKKGITLIELIITMAILMIIAIPISSLFLTTVKANKASQDLLLATQNAQQAMEEIVNGGDSPGSILGEEFTIDAEISKAGGYGAGGKKQYNSDSEYHGIISIEEEGADTATIYYIVDDSRRRIINYLNVEDDTSFYLDIKSNSIEIIKGSDTQTVNFLKEADENVKIRIECHGLNKSLTLYVDNGLTDEVVELHIVKIFNDENENKSDIDVIGLSGEVRAFTNIYYNSDVGAEDLGESELRKMTVRVTYDGEELIEINTLKKK